MQIMVIMMMMVKMMVMTVMMWNAYDYDADANNMMMIWIIMMSGNAINSLTVEKFFLESVMANKR